jgi:tRNA (guanine26-N2/guanine27-N2)-dimethyltransferase
MYANAFDDATRFDVIDLDPYGSASIFLDAAIQAIDNGGLLCVTCTDSAVLCGAHPEQLFTTCMSASSRLFLLYSCDTFEPFSSLPVSVVSTSLDQVSALKGRHCHEFGVRAILKELNGHASRYKKAIQPLLCLSIDFYFRIFVRVFDSPKLAQQSMTRVSSYFLVFSRHLYS